MDSLTPVQQSPSGEQKFPLRFFALAFSISISVSILGGWQAWRMHGRFEETSEKHMHIERDIAHIMLLDEMLTMSARMAAATGDFSYEKRYDEADPQLAGHLDHLKGDLSRAEIVRFIGETDEANAALVKLERQAFALAHQRRRQEATALLASDEYLRLKQIYAGGMEKTSKAAKGLIEGESRHMHALSVWLAAASATGILMLLAAWFVAVMSARSWVNERRKAEDALREAHDSLEDTVERRTAELLDSNAQLQRKISERQKAISSLVESEQRSRAVTESANDAIIIADNTGNLVEWNAAAERMFGHAAAEMIGQPLTVLMPERFRSPHSAGLARVAAGGATHVIGNTVELSGLRKDGSEFPLELSLAQWRSSGKTFFTAIIRDIAERKKAEAELQELLAAANQSRLSMLSMLEDQKRIDAALRESEEIFNRFMEYSPIYVFFKDENLRALRLSKNYEAMLGKPMAELLGKNMDELFPSTLAKSMVADDMRVLREGRQITVEEQFDGRFYQTIKFPVFIEGKPHFLAGYTMDVTERKKAEEAIRTSQMRFSTIFNQAPLGIALIDSHTGRIYEVNPRFAEIAGRTVEEMTTIDWMSITHPDDVQGDLDDMALMNAGKIPGFNMDKRYIRPDGSFVWINMTIAPLRLESDVSPRHLCMIDDITRRKEVETELTRFAAELDEKVKIRTAELEHAKLDAEQANRAKSEFLATMSHEIRTPMNGVIGMIDVLQQSNLNGPQMETANIIHDSAFALLNVINDILDFSKIEAGKLQIENVPISVADTVEGACESLYSMALKKGVELTLFTDPAIPASVLGDAGRLRQVLVNLANNAIKFSGGQMKQGKVSVRVLLVEDNSHPITVRGEPDITVRGELVEPHSPSTKPLALSAAEGSGRTVDGNSERVTLEFRVADNGIGIDSETQKRLFTAFTQADSTTTRTYGGTGLGLAISRQLVNIMGGEIAVQSEPGKGSVFSMRVPFDLPPEQPAANASPLLAGLSCVVVGGAESLADDLAAYLAHDGAAVKRAEDLAVAGEWINHHPPGQCVVAIDTAGGDQPSVTSLLDGLRAAARTRPGIDIRFVAIERGGRRHCRVVAADLIALDAEVMHRRTFLEAVAIAAGRYKQPVAEVKHGAKVEPALSREEARRMGSLILVAEDNEINQKVILQQLMLLGQTADITNNGREALERWQRGDYAILFADLHMPEMDGYELTAAIRAAEKESGRHRIPIIAFTANALKGEAEHCLAIGMDDYLSKPVQLLNLKAMLRKWMPKAVSPPIEVVAPTKAAPTGGRLTDHFVQALDTKEQPHSADELAQEFQIQQVELKMQNEELRQAQIALEESRDRYVNLYEFSPVGYLTLTGSGKVTEANLTGAALLGIERAKLLQRRFDHFVAPQERDCWHRFFMGAMKRESAAINLMLQRGDGSGFSAHIDCRRISENQAKPELRIAITDLSERVQDDAASTGVLPYAPTCARMVGAYGDTPSVAEKPSPSSAPVDVNVLKALIGDDEAMIREFLHDYRLSAAKTAAELRAACAAGEAATASALAHKLKSSSRSVGALALGELCAALEQAGKGGDAEALAALLPKFERELAGVEGFLEGY